MMTAAVAFVLFAVLGQASGYYGGNIARGGKVTQSSVGWYGFPARAIDGNCDGIYGHKSCSCTNYDQNPWWQLDLLKTYKINTVTVTNRRDCCYKRINGAEIRIGNSPDVNRCSRCAVISYIAPGASATFHCRGLVGRYVTIVIPGRREYLTLCEVKVTGQPNPKPKPKSCLHHFFHVIHSHVHNFFRHLGK